MTSVVRKWYGSVSMVVRPESCSRIATVWLTGGVIGGVTHSTVFDDTKSASTKFSGSSPNWHQVP